MLDLHILEDDERNHMSLPEHPDWLQFYESPELKVIRDCSVIDHLREEGFFDDVYAILPTTVIIDIRSGKPITLGPEIVWVRLNEYSDQTKQFRGRLLNQPNQEFGVHKNEVVSLWPIKSGGDLVLIVGK